MARDIFSTLANRTLALDECESAKGRMRLAVAILFAFVLVLLGALAAFIICDNATASSGVSPSNPRRDGLPVLYTRAWIDPLRAGSSPPTLGDTLEEA